MVQGQGVSTRRWAMALNLWGLLLLRDPPQFSLELQGTQFPWEATVRYCRES